MHDTTYDIFIVASLKKQVHEQMMTNLVSA
jgi:hypothetical protein